MSSQAMSELIFADDKPNVEHKSLFFSLLDLHNETQIKQSVTNSNFGLSYTFISHSPALVVP